jgi:hypothetical protein
LRPLRIQGLHLPGIPVNLATYPVRTALRPTISRLSDDHRKLVEHGGLWVPRSFMATFDRPGLPLLIFGIALVDGRFRCVELQVRRREENAHLEAGDLRKVKIAQLVREAVRLVCYFRDELFDEEDDRVGMTAHPRFATWEKELRPGRA